MVCDLSFVDELLPLPRSAETAVQRARLALSRAEARGQPFEMCQALADLARCYQAAGAGGAAMTLLSQSLNWSRLVGSTDLVVDLLCELCESGAACNPREMPREAALRTRERARAHASEAARLAAHVADPCWEIKVLLRISDVLDRLGDHADALALQSRALALMAPPSVHAAVAEEPAGSARGAES